MSEEDFWRPPVIVLPYEEIVDMVCEGPEEEEKTMAQAKRVYKKGAKNSEYDAYHGTAEQRKRRSQRTIARNKALKKGTVKKGDGKEIHHVGAKRLGSLAKTKTKVVSRAANRKIQPKRGKSKAKGNPDS